MGMSIDEAIKNGIDLIDAFKKYFPSDKVIDTVGELVEIAKKYQKIKEIVTNNELEWGNTSVRANALWEVKKVIEDGNVDW